jgi:arylsulfatase A-like enzyme
MYPSKMEGLSYQVDGWKLIWTIRDQTGKRDRWELYHVAEDPREQTDLAGREPARLAELQKLMTEARRAQQRIKVEGVRTTLDPETLKALKSLGYVE